MKLFNILRSKEVESKEWSVLYRTRKMEMKTFRLMAKSESEVISKFRRIFRSGEYIGATEVK